MKDDHLDEEKHDDMKARMAKLRSMQKGKRGKKRAKIRKSYR